MSICVCVCLYWNIDRMKKVVKPKNGELILDSGWSVVHGISYKADKRTVGVEEKGKNIKQVHTPEQTK